MAGALIALAGCSNRDPYVTNRDEVTSGNWKIARQTDRITGTPLPSVSDFAPASNTYVDYPKPAIMQLTCFDGAPLVRFAFPFKIGSDVNTFLGYRFDDRPGRDSIAGVRFLQEFQTVVMEDKADIARFVDEMKGASLLYLRIRSITQGRTTAEFKLDGSEAALQAAFADCPLPPVAPTASPQVKKRIS